MKATIRHCHLRGAERRPRANWSLAVIAATSIPLPGPMRPAKFGWLGKLNKAGLHPASLLRADSPRAEAAEPSRPSDQWNQWANLFIATLLGGDQRQRRCGDSSERADVTPLGLTAIRPRVPAQLVPRNFGSKDTIPPGLPRETTRGVLSISWSCRSIQTRSGCAPGRRESGGQIAGTE